MIYVSTVGGPRKDGRTNHHRVYRVLPDGKPPYFQHVPGPWEQTFDTSCVVAADINNDGRDDLIVCERKGYARMFVQSGNGKFTQLKLPAGKANWRNVRVANVLKGDGGPQLVVVEGWGSQTPYLKIFRGLDQQPFFNLLNPYYTLKLPHAAADLEVVDVDNDSYADIYVLQSNERTGYCSIRGKALTSSWGGGGSPPPMWIPPKNSVPDLLLVGKPKKGGVAFSSVKISHRGNGCGGKLSQLLVHL